MKKIDYSIYLCTDRTIMSSKTLEEGVEEAILGGATIIQLREKDCSSMEFLNIGLNIKKITDKYDIPLIINDRIDIALALRTDGVHIGNDDMPLVDARRILPKDMIIGVSVTNRYEAIQAEKDGASYLGVGAMYATSTKKDAKMVSMEELEEIRKSVKIPIVVIGGITKENLLNFKHKGIDGLAIISAILKQENIRKSTEELLRLWKD